MKCKWKIVHTYKFYKKTKQLILRNSETRCVILISFIPCAVDTKVFEVKF